MDIKKLNFERKEIQIRETYIDEKGRTRERIRSVGVPTGNIIRNNSCEDSECEEKKNSQSACFRNSD